MEIKIIINETTNKKLNQVLPKLKEHYYYSGNDALWMIFLKGLDHYIKEILKDEQR